MRLTKITWKIGVVWGDRVSCMAVLLNMVDPPMPSEYFLNDIWMVGPDVPFNKKEALKDE